MTFGEMGLRCLLVCVLASLLAQSGAISRQRRQSVEAKPYQPPIALGSHGASSPTSVHQNSYQPPISMTRSHEYPAPPPQIPSNAVPGTTYQAGGHTFVLQPQPRSQSVQYVPPNQPQPQHSYSVFPPPSVHQQVAQGLSTGGQSSSSFSVLAGPAPQHQSTAERTYSSSSHSKVVESSHAPAQAIIHKAPASEIAKDAKAAAAAKEKDKAGGANDEYVVYYYYYYDNDTTAGNNNNNNNNLTLNFDDIPSLEGYDVDAAKLVAKDAKEIISANSVSTETQPRSVGGGRSVEEAAAAQVKPVSNVFRYGSNEVPRFPVLLPNLIVTEAPPTTQRPEASTVPTVESPATAAQPLDPKKKTDDHDDDDSNNVLLPDSSLSRSVDDKVDEELPAVTTPASTTTSTTTTEPSTTTTEEQTTTTERPSRRRPPLGGSRRRFNSSPSSTNRNRQSSFGGSRSTSSSTSSTSTTSTTTASTPARRTFGGSNRIRPRPPISGSRTGGRPASSSSTTEAGGGDAQESSPSTAAPTRSRFTSAAPRRFQSSRSRSTSQRSTSTSTSTTTRSPPVSRSRPGGGRPQRPSSSLISSTGRRPPRPGFLRPRPGSEVSEEPDTTTAVSSPVEEATSPVESTEDEDNETDNETDETEEEEEEATEATTTTTTEANRFSALFRPRNRNALGGNRPRPVLPGNRPSRS